MRRAQARAPGRAGRWAHAQRGDRGWALEDGRLGGRSCACWLACPGPRPGSRPRTCALARGPGPVPGAGSRTGAARLRRGGEEECARTGDFNPGCNYPVRAYSPSMHFFWGGDVPHYSPTLHFLAEFFNFLTDISV